MRELRTNDNETTLVSVSAAACRGDSDCAVVVETAAPAMKVRSTSGTPAVVGVAAAVPSHCVTFAGMTAALPA